MTVREQTVLLLNWRDTTNPEGGGSERYVEEVARGLAELGWSVTMLCAAYPGSPREARRHGVRYLYRGSKVTVYLRGLLHTWLHRPDRVVDVQNGLPFFTRLVRRTGVVVLVHHVHQEQWQVVYPGWKRQARLVARVPGGSPPVPRLPVRDGVLGLTGRTGRTGSGCHARRRSTQRD